MSRRLSYILNVLGVAILHPVLGLRASAQVDQFLPEIDVLYKLNSDIRVSFQAKETREGGDATQAELGPSIEFYLKPLIKLEKVTLFDLDDSKSRPLVLSIGYHFLPSPGSPPTSRMEPVATAHFPLGPDSCYRTGTVQTLIGKVASSRGAIAIVLKSKDGWQVTRIILLLTQASSSSTRANTANGVTRQSMPGACFRSANT